MKTLKERINGPRRLSPCRCASKDHIYTDDIIECVEALRKDICVTGFCNKFVLCKICKEVEKWLGGLK